MKRKQLPILGTMMLAMLLLASVLLPAHAQQATVRGTVTSADDNATLPGVNVLIKGTTEGTTTSADGTYALPVTPGAVLQFSFIGFVSQEVTVGNQTVINITLQPDVSQLDEVVVLGYNTASKKEIASSVSSIKSEEITAFAVSDIRQAMQGRMAGVQVVNNNGTPGSGAKVVIRGVGSFASVEPIYVIDGIAGGDINSVQPQDIESITVLKDAPATAIYGSAGANGAVIITTKTGKKGKPVLTYDGSMGFSEVTRRYDMLNASDYVDLVADIQATGGLQITDKLKTPEVRQDRTDWQDAVFRRGAFDQHSLSLSGGTEALSFVVSTGYTRQESTIIDRNFQRATFGTKLVENFGRFKLMQNLRLKYDQNDGVLAGFADALRMPPYVGIYDPNNLGGYARADKTTDLNDANNPYNGVYNTDRNNNNLSINLELSAEVSILKSLSFKSQGRISGGNDNTFQFNRPSAGGNFIRNQADMTEGFGRSYHYILDNFLTFDQNFGEHSLNVILGNQYLAPTWSRRVDVAGSNFINTEIQNIGLADSRTVQGAGVNSGNSRISYFTRIGYSYRNKYIFNFSMRRDGSSVFGANNRWGNFPGVGLGWNISQESFMSGIPAISNLKLRASWGVTGNDNITPFVSSAQVWRGSGNNIVYSFGDGTGFSNGSTFSVLPNENIKWEETVQTNVGFDLDLLNDKLGITFDYYQRNNNDLLIRTPVALSTGFGEGSGSGSQWVNAASMINKGFEIALNYRNRVGEFTYNVGVNTSYNQNEVTALGTINNTPINNGEFESGIGNATRTDIGHPISSFFGYRVDRVAVDQADVDRLNQRATEATNGQRTQYHQGLRPGDFVFQDVDGNGFIDDRDRTFIGNPAPRWQYGGNVTLGYKGFDLDLVFMGVADVEVVNGTKYWLDGMSKPFNGTENTLRRWRQPGDVTDMPRAAQNSGRNLAFSTWYVEDGSYFRMRNVTIGYKLPGSLLNSLTKNVVRSLRVYLTAQNLFTITNYSGYDPEISSRGTGQSDFIFQRGIDHYQFPNPKTYRAGVQLTF